MTQAAEQPRGNGAAGAPIVCGQDNCPGIPQHQITTEDRVRRLPVSGGIVAIALGGLLALGVWALQQHNVSAMSHPDIRAARAQSRAETTAFRKEVRDGLRALGRQAGDTKAILDELRRQDDGPAPKRRRGR